MARWWFFFFINNAIIVYLPAVCFVTWIPKYTIDTGPNNIITVGTCKRYYLLMRALWGHPCTSVSRHPYRHYRKAYRRYLKHQNCFYFFGFSRAWLLYSFGQNIRAVHSFPPVTYFSMLVLLYISSVETGHVKNYSDIDES